MEKKSWKKKFTQDIPFPEAKKIIETTLSAQSYFKSNTPHTKHFHPQNAINAIS